MKKLFLISTSILLFGCSESTVQKRKTGYHVFDGANPLEIIEIDSCQYFLGDWGYGTVLTHKGNCKNHHISVSTDSLDILKQEITDLKKYVLKLEEDNKLMGSYLANSEFNPTK
jgi:hypothetical protein